MDRQVLVDGWLALGVYLGVFGLAAVLWAGAALLVARTAATVRVSRLGLRR